MPSTRRARITKTLVDELQPGQIIRDTELTGFGVRRQRGAPVYFLQKRVNRRTRWMTIGAHGQGWTVEKARKEAFSLLGSIAEGDDPAAQKAVDKTRSTVVDVIPQFLAHHGPKLKPRTREEYERIFKLHIVPAFGKRRIDDISRADVTKFHADRKETKAGANFCLACLSKLMSWAEDAGFRPYGSNPCRRVAKYRINNRERFLSEEEFARLGSVLTSLEEEEGAFVIAAVRLLLLTGARLNEVLTLKWSYVDLERKLLLLPDSKTGQKAIRLNDAAVDVLKAIPRLKTNPHVFPGRKDGEHIVNLQKPWRRIREAAGLEDVRLHDLRHSFASVAAASGASLQMIGKLLGHTRPQTTARYAHLAEDPTRELNDKVGQVIARVTGHKVRSEAEELAANEAELERLRALVEEAEKLKHANGGI